MKFTNDETRNAYLKLLNNDETYVRITKFIDKHKSRVLIEDLVDNLLDFDDVKTDEIVQAFIEGV